MDYRLKTLAEYVRGWMGYFGISDYYRPIPELDHWLRRRIRMCYWKQWRGVRNRIHHLLALGTPKRAAIWTGMSSKSYWRLSRSLGTQTGMTNDCEYLGFTFRGKKLRWSERAYHDFRHRLRKLTGRSWGVSMDYRLKKLSEYVRGWMGYFGISEYYRPIPELDHWLRRRVRMCYWKQWRGERNRIRHLLALGTPKRAAIWTGMSSKSYWHLSRSLGTQTGMTNDWLKGQGLISIRDHWMSAHGYV
jgi:hypothetical protein